MSRKHISLKTKLASAITIVLAIPYDHAKNMSEDQILSLVEWDHWPRRKADGGTDEFHNIMPRTIAAHALKTAKVDLPTLAKIKRIQSHPIVTGLKVLPMMVDFDTKELLRRAPLKRRIQSRKMQSRPWPKKR